jgi:hypothetical protein
MLSGEPFNCQSDKVLFDERRLGVATKGNYRDTLRVSFVCMINGQALELKKDLSFEERGGILNI